MIKTKQELLNHFSDINAMYNNPFMYQTLSNMIDELLEQQPCTDAISREDAMSMILCYGNEIKAEVMDDIKASMIKLPSVTPSYNSIKTELKQQTRWIPVSERLPERVEWCLTSIKWVDGTERVIISWFDGMSFKAEVIAWMPLPQPYTEGDDEYETNNS